MGTSISQPSPKGNEPGAKAWQDAQDSLKAGDKSSRVTKKIFAAFASEYGAGTVSKIADPGVKSVYELLGSFKANKSESLAKFVSRFSKQAKRNLAASGINSFFAELAIVAATKTFTDDESGNIKQRFSIEFLNLVIEYVISRDLPNTIGAHGIPNLDSLEHYLEEIRGLIKRILLKEEIADLEVALKWFLPAEDEQAE